MKALVLDIKEWESTKGMKLLDVPLPELDEVRCPADANKCIIKPLYTGFCGSDKGIWFRHAFKDMIFDSIHQEAKSYRICGHELLGEIVETGSYAKSHYGYKPGDIVATESHIFCGRCHQCKIGDAHVCSDHLIIGISTDGCFAEQVKLPAKELWPTDLDKIRPEVAAIQEPLGNAVHACSRVDLRGKTVAIFGCGTIGLFTVLVARAMGATTIIGIDPDKNNLKIAEELGLDSSLHIPLNRTQNPTPSPDLEIAEKIRQQCFGEGVDVAFEMSGSNQALNTAIASTRAGGDIILFGISSGDYTLTDFQNIILLGKSMHSVVGRKVFQTWYIASNLLMSQGHSLQDKIYEVILNRGVGTLFPFKDFNPTEFEKAITSHPKIVLKYD
ncbi:MAG: zinc-binding dehydrogenase [Nitrospinaceae bacterium]|nr:zinc-binding dehydrogenase [Nitrospina sp.]MBT5376128.1 zinc-binding dehydrogenase [Nitrospinaceae bacterium]MBT5868963.1 zinc-binding dehydrogenase [Nitrospinaceae bacterium]